MSEFHLQQYLTALTSEVFPSEVASFCLYYTAESREKQSVLCHL